MRYLIIFALITGCVLGYGYHHSITHGTFHIQLDRQGSSDNKPNLFPKTEVILQDAKGNALATGTNDEKYNFIHLIHPETGDCREAEIAASSTPDARTGWQRCFEHLSRWIPRWARKVHQVELTMGGCPAITIPVTVSHYNSDWFLWWVPHPHIGGKPYTYFTLYIEVNENYCENSLATHQGEEHTMICSSSLDQ